MNNALEVPAGFTAIDTGGEFIRSNGPLYLRHVGEGEQVQVGFRVEARHCNPLGFCHGGMLASFADMVLPMVAVRTAPPVPQGSPLPNVRERFLPTISLQLDYIAPARLGQWVQGEGQILRVTQSLVFMQGLVTSGGALALRCSGVFKIGPLYKHRRA